MTCKNREDKHVVLAARNAFMEMLLKLIHGREANHRDLFALSSPREGARNVRTVLTFPRFSATM